MRTTLRFLVIIALCFGIGDSGVYAQSGSAAIFIDVETVGEGSGTRYNVTVTVNPRGGGDHVPVSIDLPWYAETELIQCIGDCGEGASSDHSSAIGEAEPSNRSYIFTVTITDDTYSAFGIYVTAGSSQESLFVPIERGETREVDSMGEVRIIALFEDSEATGHFVIDVDALLPLSGGFVAIVPAGLTVVSVSSCVVPDTRVPSDYGQMCQLVATQQPNGDIWLQAMLPSGAFSMQIVLAPEEGFESGEVEMSVGGRYFESEIVDVQVPGDFRAPGAEGGNSG